MPWPPSIWMSPEEQTDPLGQLMAALNPQPPAPVATSAGPIPPPPERQGVFQPQQPDMFAPTTPGMRPNDMLEGGIDPNAPVDFTTPAGLMESYNALQQATGAEVAAKAEAEEKKAQMGATLGADVSAQFDQLEVERRERDAKIKDLHFQYLREADELAREKVDPKRVFHKAGTPRTIGAAIVAALAGAGDPKNGPRMVADTVGGIIDRDVEAQVTDMANKKGALQEKRMLLAEEMDRGRADYEAKSKVILTQWAIAEKQVEYLMKGFDSQVTKAMGKRIQAEIAIKQAEVGNDMRADSERNVIANRAIDLKSQALSQDQQYKERVLALREAELTGSAEEKAKAREDLNAYRERTLGLKEQELGIKKEAAAAKKTTAPQTAEGLKGAADTSGRIPMTAIQDQKLMPRAIADPLEPDKLLGIAHSGTPKDVSDARALVTKNTVMIGQLGRLKAMQEYTAAQLRINKGFLETPEGIAIETVWKTTSADYAYNMSGATMTDDQRKFFESVIRNPRGLKEAALQRLNRGQPEPSWTTMQTTLAMKNKAAYDSIAVTDPVTGKSPSWDYWQSVITHANDEGKEVDKTPDQKQAEQLGFEPIGTEQPPQDSGIAAKAQGMNPMELQGGGFNAEVENFMDSFGIPQTGLQSKAPDFGAEYNPAGKVGTNIAEAGADIVDEIMNPPPRTRTKGWRGVKDMGKEFGHEVKRGAQSTADWVRDMLGE